MSYLQTVLTYNQPSEAEVDKAFLESHGIDVCLLNANTSRNELGAPFYIQLQVAGEDLDRARQILKEANPQRFGSPERVAAIDQAIKQAVFRFLAGAVIVAAVAYFLIPDDNVRIVGAAISGLVAGVLAASFQGGKK